MNYSYCPTYDILNCSEFEHCYVCNVTTAEIERKYNILPFCSETNFCISDQKICNDKIYFDDCIISSNIVKTGIGLLIFFLYVFSYNKLLNVLQINRYSEVPKFIIISLYTTINLIIPFVLLSITHLIYLEYFGVCILSFMFTCFCLPSSRISRRLTNLNYNPYRPLSHTMPITPTESPTERIIHTIPEDQNENPPAYEDLESNNQTPTFQYQT